jgi:hypothetical protein
VPFSAGGGSLSAEAGNHREAPLVRQRRFPECFLVLSDSKGLRGGKFSHPPRRASIHQLWSRTVVTCATESRPVRRTNTRDRRFHSHFVGFQGFAARKSFPSASGRAPNSAPAICVTARLCAARRSFRGKRKRRLSRSHRSGRVEGLDMGGFQRGQERTLPYIGIFRNKNIAILKTPRHARVAGGQNPWVWRPNHRAVRG